MCFKYVKIHNKWKKFLQNIVKLKEISTIKDFRFGFGLHFLPTTYSHPSKWNNRIFENDHFQNCVYFWCFFLVLKPQCTAKWHVFYIRNRHISVGSFVYKYDQWPHDSYMTGRAGVWEADDIVKFYIALLDFFPATL